MGGGRFAQRECADRIRAASGSRQAQEWFREKQALKINQRNCIALKYSGMTTWVAGEAALISAAN